MRVNAEEKRTSNRTVANRLLRQHFKCSYCRPNRGENTHYQKRPDKPRSKDHRCRHQSSST